MITNTRKVLYTTTANKDDGVLLEIMSFTANVGDHFFAIGQTDLGNFTKSRVRLLRRTSHYLKTNTTTLRAAVEGTRLGLLFRSNASFADELIDCRHVSCLVLVRRSAVSGIKTNDPCIAGTGLFSGGTPDRKLIFLHPSVPYWGNKYIN